MDTFYKFFIWENQIGLCFTGFLCKSMCFKWFKLPIYYGIFSILLSSMIKLTNFKLLKRMNSIFLNLFLLNKKYFKLGQTRISEFLNYYSYAYSMISMIKLPFASRRTSLESWAILCGKYSSWLELILNSYKQFRF